MALNKINTQEMRVVANSVEQMAGEYTQYVNKLYEAGSELDKMWDGDANDKFNTQMTEDLPRFNALNKVIEQYVQCLRDNADAYDKSEAEACETLQTKTLRRK